MGLFFQHILKRKEHLTLLFGVLLFFGFACATFFYTPTAYSAGAPMIITYQGRLYSSGLAVTTTQSMKFVLYNAQTGGSALYSASGTPSSPVAVSVSPSSGVFTVNLGDNSTNPITNDIFGDNQNVFMEVIVGATTLTPRRQLTAAPYAINSQLLMGVTATTTSSSLYIPTSDALGNFDFTGWAGGGKDFRNGIISINPSSTLSRGYTLFGVGAEGGSYFRVDDKGDVYIDGSIHSTGTTRLSNGAIYADAISGFAGINSSTPHKQFSVEGDSWFNGTTTHKGGLQFNTVGAFDTQNLLSFQLGAHFYSQAIASPSFLFSTAFENPSSTLQHILKVRNGAINDAFSIDTGGNAIAFGNSTALGAVYGNLGLYSSTTLAVTGNSTFYGNLTVSGVSDVLTVNGTSALATTTINGDFTVDSGTFYVDNQNNRVGVSTSSPSRAFSVEGQAVITGTTTIQNTLVVQGRAENPVHISTLSSVSSAYDLEVDGQYAYIASRAAGFTIVDISDPRDPSLVFSIDPGANVEGIDVQGGFAYLASTSDGLRIFDVTNPYNAFEIRQNQGNSVYAGDVFVQGTTAYVTDGSSGSLHVFDISDPRTATSTGNISIDGAAAGLTVVNNYAYVASNFGADDFTVVDVTNPANPVEVGQLVLDSSYDVDVDGKYAYVAGGSSGVYVVNISDPTNPLNVGSIDPGLGIVKDVKVSGNNLYASDDGDELHIIDITSSTAPYLLKTLSLNDIGNARKIDVQGNYAYIAAEGGGLKVVDIGGAEIANADIGSGYLNRLTVQNQGEFQNSLYVRNGLHVGAGGAQFGGALSFYTSSTLASGSATNTLNFSHTALFTASSTAGTMPSFVFDTRDTVASSTNNYLLSVRNNGTSKFSISANGDLRSAGEIYAMGTVIGTPGSPGDLAERVDIAADQTVEPGDVMIVDPRTTDTYMKSFEGHTASIAGVISTNPTIVIGDGRTEHTATLALTGRLPVKATAENGPINRGDLLVSASTSGYAMKYDPTKDTGNNIIGVIGMALEGLAEGEGKVMTLVKTGWVNDPYQTIAAQQAAFAAEVAEDGGTDPQILNVVANKGKLVRLDNNLDVNNYSLVNVKSVVGSNNRWYIDESGRFVTRVATHEGATSLYAIQSQDTEYIFSGSSALEDGMIRINFDEVTKSLIDPEQPIRVSVTMTENSKGVYVREKDHTGFLVLEKNGGESEATFDWVVIAKRVVGDAEIVPDVDDPQGQEDEPAEELSEGEPAEEQSNEAEQGEEQIEESPVEQQPVEEVEILEEQLEPPAEEPTEEVQAEEPTAELEFVQAEQGEEQIEEPPVEQQPVEEVEIPEEQSEPPAEEPTEEVQAEDV